jgi:hypothetical protein
MKPVTATASARRGARRLRAGRLFWVGAVCLLVACGGAEDPGSADADASPDQIGADVEVGPDAALDVPGPDSDPGDAAVTADQDAPDAETEPNGDAADGDGDAADGDTAPDATTAPRVTKTACAADADCALGCATGASCVEGVCAWAGISGCVVDDAATGESACVDAGEVWAASGCLFCNPAHGDRTWTGVLVAEGFEQGAGAFSQTQVLGDPDAVWATSEARAGGGQHSLYFGVAGASSYATGGRSAGRALGPAVPVPAGVPVELRFLVWLDTEETKGYDFLRAFAVLDDGEEITLWHSDSIGGTTRGEFLPVSAAVPAIASQTVRLGFEFDTLDDLINGYEGAYIDQVALTTGCCIGASDCQDDNPCTVDLCPNVGEVCGHAPVPGCCNLDAECTDGDTCTADGCTGFGGSCTYSSLPGCCHGPTDCDDGDPCTEDLCSGDGGTCTHKPLCCKDDAGCDDFDDCTAEQCVEGQCVFEFTCCLSASDCNDFQTCTTDECVDGACVHTAAPLPGCCVPTVLDEHFDVGSPADWKFSPTTSGVGWQVATLSQAQSPPGALYYGNPATLNFNSGTANSGSATTGAIVLPEDVEITLSMAAYMDTESGSGFDILEVFVVTQSNEFKLFAKSDFKSGGWKAVTADLSYLAGKTISLRFAFNTVDSTVNNGLGVLIDDLKITTSCEPRACASALGCPSKDGCIAGVCQDSQCKYVDSCCKADTDCDDGGICTIDTCTNSKCKFTAIAQCCEDVTDCDDKDACTLDSCSGFGGSCTHTPIPGCCKSNADCDDKNDCTKDACEQGVCAQTFICCASDGDCDDGDPVCTLDQCVGGFCQNPSTGAEGCCDAQPVDWDFDTPVALTTTKTTLSCFWSIIDSPLAQSGSQVLYYGDPVAEDYDCGDNAGTATSADIALYAGVNYTLSFKLYMDTESLNSWDQFVLRAVVGTKSYDLWTKAKLNGTAKWATHTVDLNAFAGQTVRFVFSFDSVDDSDNGGLGVLIDDFFVTSSCAPKSCTTGASCDDGVSGTTALCTDGVCTFKL